MNALGPLQYLSSIAKEIPSVGDLRRKSEVTDDEIEVATAAYLKDKNAKPFAFKSGHIVDNAHLNRRGTGDVLRRRTRRRSSTSRPSSRTGALKGERCGEQCDQDAGLMSH